MAREIPLTRGYVAIVDDEDFDRVASKKWSLAETDPGRFYASRGLWVSGRGSRPFYLHRFLMDPPAGALVDHRNGNGLDNRRENLRLATRSLNCVNRTSYQPMSGCRGVYQNRKNWRAWISVNGRGIELGTFGDKEAAARAYDAAALQHFGAFAVLNFTQPERA